ncbi:IncA family protein [Chlamydia buteonis]|uniref:IncA family protein n=1 Tax=Chlamydia buteonis TaxID=2494525 RepID=A0ABX8LA10_9CHLA|nr:IncA family protein [Chlamydia buteonis]QXE26849.1 IncA family protein [Chlamydia buteonis]QXE28203.1 IncA family protein [Chlamydia buteonis]
MTTNPVNTNPIATFAPTTQHTLSNILSSKYQRIATVIALLAGMVLIGTLIGALVFFALPTSVTLVALVSIALLASVILLSMAMYNLISQSRKVPSDAQLGEENTRLQAEMIELREQLIRSESKFEEEQGRCSELSMKLMSAIGDLEQVNQEKVSLESKVHALQELAAGHPAISVEAQKIQKELREKVSELALANQNISILEGQVQSLETQLTKSSQQLEALSKQNKELETHLQQLQEEGVSSVVALQGKVADLVEKSEIKDKDLELRNERIVSLLNQNTTLFGKVASLERELEQDQEVIDKLESRITLLAHTRNELTEQIKNFRCDLEAKAETILRLEDRVQELEKEKKEVEDELHKAQIQITTLEASISHKDSVSLSDSARLLGKVAKLQEQLEEKSKEISSLLNEKASLTVERNKLQEDLAALQEQLASSASSVSSVELAEADPDSSEAPDPADHLGGSGNSNDFEG